MVRKAIWFFIFGLMAVSCLEEPECYSLNNNIVGIAFKKLSDKKADTVAMVSVTAAGTDSVFFSNTLMTGANLPLDYFNDTTIFTFEGVSQTSHLTLSYKSQPQFVSVDCGERFVLTDLKAAFDGFDSVRVAGTVPKGKYASGTQVEIFRCPNTSRIKLRFLSNVTITQIITDYPTSIAIPSGATSSLLVPLNTEASSSALQFTFSDGTVKNLVIGYKVERKQFFHACGEQAVISDFTAESNFTSVKVLRNAITDPNQTNLEITF